MGLCVHVCLCITVILHVLILILYIVLYLAIFSNCNNVNFTQGQFRDEARSIVFLIT